MKKITIIEIIVVALVFIALIVYFAPKFINNREDMLEAKIKANNAVFTAKVLEEFSSNKNAKPSLVCQKVLDELNAVEKNPYNKKENAFTFDKNCSACNSVEYDDNLSIVIITTYDKKGELHSRTVIKPPSFVTYNKEEK